LCVHDYPRELFLGFVLVQYNTREHSTVGRHTTIRSGIGLVAYVKYVCHIHTLQPRSDRLCQYPCQEKANIAYAPVSLTDSKIRLYGLLITQLD